MNTTTFNTQAQASSLSGTVPSGRTERPDTDQAFKALDSGNKGYLTADDLQAAVVKISAEGARRADAAQGGDAAGKPAPSAQAVLARLDSDSDGKVTEQEFKAAAPKAAPADGAGGAQAAQPAGGQPAASGVGGAAGGAAGGVSSSARTYEPADTNEDGEVSAREQQAYDAKLAADKAAQAAGGGRTAEADAAVKAYESVVQLGQGNGAATA